MKDESAKLSSFVLQWVEKALWNLFSGGGLGADYAKLDAYFANKVNELKNIDLAAIGVTSYDIYVNKVAMETGVDPDIIKLYAKDTEVQRLLNLIDTREGYGLNSLYKDIGGKGAFMLGRAVPGAALGVGYTNRFPSLNIFGQLLRGPQSSGSGLILPGAELFTESGVPIGLSPGEALDTAGQEFIDISGQNDSIGAEQQAGSRESKQGTGIYFGKPYNGIRNPAIDFTNKNGSSTLKKHNNDHANEQYVHLSQDQQTAIVVGKRRDANPVVLRVDAKAAWQDGIRFYHGNEMIWLADSIPTKYLCVIE